MIECICSSCKNLKNTIDENDIDQNGFIESCEFGFPSEACSECEVDGCELTCENYISDDEDENLVVLKCVKCAKELKISPRNSEDGEVFCVSCYLSK